MHCFIGTRVIIPGELLESRTQFYKTEAKQMKYLVNKLKNIIILNDWRKVGYVLYIVYLKSISPLNCLDLLEHYFIWWVV